MKCTSIDVFQLTFSSGLGGLKRLHGKISSPAVRKRNPVLLAWNYLHVIAGCNLWRVYNTAVILAKRGRISSRSTRIMQSPPEFFLQCFYKVFYKAFVNKPFQILSLVLISISHENTIETSLSLKKCHLAKFCKIDAWSQALLFTGETSFFSRFFFNIPEISAQIQKPTKC